METLRDLQLVRAFAPAPELRAVEDDGGLADLAIRFSAFNAWYEINSMFEGRFLERTVPGSFAKTISENRSNIKVLFNHGFDVTGEQVLGPVVDLREEDDSPVGIVRLLDTSYNRDLLPGLRAGLYGSSMRFQVMRDEWNDKPKRSEFNPDGLPERTIKEVRLMEFGPVTFPANPSSTAGVRAMTDDYYERLSARDSRVKELIARAVSLRTPNAEAVREGTSAEGAANPTDAPTAEGGHPSGLSPMERRSRLIQILTH